jgi:hypothetical protein
MSRSARLDEIRDAASDFVCAESAMEGASLGLGALFGAFGCRAAMAHLLDESAAEFAVVAALGEGASAHVLSRNHMSDWALSAAAHSKRPVLLSYSEYSPEPPARHAAFGVAKKVLLVPAVSPDQRVLGVIELVDTKGVLALDKETVSTLVAFGERLGALIGSKGIRLGNLLGQLALAGRRDDPDGRRYLPAHPAGLRPRRRPRPSGLTPRAPASAPRERAPENGSAGKENQRYFAGTLAVAELPR